jgi:trehalose-phosphatase
MQGRRLAAFNMNQTSSGVPYLFDGWEQISKRVREAADIRLFLDFDGTLVAYRDSPEDVKLSLPCRRVMARLARHRRVHVAIVSGRRNAALRNYIQVPGIQFLGLFGWEKRGRPAISRRTRIALRGLRPGFAVLAAMFPEIRVEAKGISYSIHYRGASPNARRRVLLRIRILLSRAGPGIRVIQSNHASEIVPREVQGKGVAMSQFVQGLRASFLPIYVGDDLTDEPAFGALRSGITVRVGPFSKTRAHFRLPDPDEVCIFLERLEGEIS